MIRKTGAEDFANRGQGRSRGRDGGADGFDMCRRDSEQQLTVFSAVRVQSPARLCEMDSARHQRLGQRQRQRVNPGPYSRCRAELREIAHQAIADVHRGMDEARFAGGAGSDDARLRAAMGLDQIVAEFFGLVPGPLRQQGKAGGGIAQSAGHQQKVTDFRAGTGQRLTPSGRVPICVMLMTRPCGVAFVSPPASRAP